MHLNKSGMRTGYSVTGVLVSLVTLSFLMLLGLNLFNRHDRAQLAENTAHQLTMQISLAREEAMLHKQTLALMLQNHSYRFYVKNTVNNVAWLPLQNDQFLDYTALPTGIVVQVHSQNSPTTIITDQSKLTSPTAILVRSASVQTTRTYLNQLSPTSAPATISSTILTAATPSTSTLTASPSNNMQPAVIFYPQGNITSFTLDVGLKDLMPNYQIIGTSAGDIDLKVYSDNFVGLPMK